MRNVSFCTFIGHTQCWFTLHADQFTHSVPVAMCWCELWWHRSHNPSDAYSVCYEQHWWCVCLCKLLSFQVCYCMCWSFLNLELVSFQIHAENLEVCGKLIMFRQLAHHANSKFFKLLPIELVNQTGCFRIISKSKLFCSCFVLRLRLERRKKEDEQFWVVTVSCNLRTL